MYWIHVLHMLAAGFRLNRTGHVRALYEFYLSHHALTFLHSGVTSGSGGRGYLWWLTIHHVAPADW